MATIPGTLAVNAGRCPDRLAVVFGERSYTYAELDGAVNQAAHALGAAGLRQGDRMLLMSGNSDQFLVALFAALRLGALVVPVNPASAAPELAHILADSGASLLVFGGGTQTVVRAAGSFLDSALAGAPIALDPVEGYRNLSNLAAGHPATPPGADVAESDDALILYTSGTTGRPKGVLLDHHRALWFGINTCLAFGLRDGDRILHVAPMYHAAELAMLVCGGMLVGATHVVLPSFAPQAVLDALERHRITVFFGVPAMYQLLLRDPSLPGRDLAAWRVGLFGAAPMPASAVRAAVAALPHVELIQGCGQTEGIGIYCTAEEVRARPDASGRRAIFLTEARVVDPHGIDVPPGGTGELILRGETVMKGYWRNPEATAEALRGGWLHTGDLATIDADGYITLVDRMKDMIISGGRNIYSVEVENALAAHPAIAEIAIIARKHEVYGETVVAVVNPLPGQAITLEELRDFGAGRLSGYKLPRELIVRSIPRNPSGKVLKHVLRADLEKTLGTDKTGGPGTGSNQIPVAARSGRGLTVLLRRLPGTWRQQDSTCRQAAPPGVRAPAAPDHRPGRKETTMTIMTTRQPAGMAAAPPAAATAEHAQGSDQREPRLKILVAGWDSGGGVEAVQTVVRRAVARGHQVRVLGTAGLRDRFEPAGAAFRVYRYAPDNDMRRPETDLVKEWEARTPLGAFARVRDKVMFGPARLFCRDILEELDREPADVVAVDTLIPSALAGAEAAGVPAVLLMHGPYALPRPGAPLISTGFLPPRGRPGRLRDRAAGSLAMRLFRSGLPALNRARAELGLAPVRDLGELAASASRILVCTSPGYDFAADAVPGNVSYVGPQLKDGGGAARDDPRTGADDRPLVLVSFSSTVMHQEALLQKAAEALGRLPVRALVTTGPAVDPAVIQAPPNVSVRRWARHADVLPFCSAVLTHGGHGTVIKALAAGVPLVVVPLGRDQPGNAARVVHAGAGVRVRKNAPAAALHAAIARVLDDQRYLAASRRMSAILAAERDDGLVVDELERAAARGRECPGGPAWPPPADHRHETVRSGQYLSPTPVRARARRPQPCEPGFATPGPPALAMA